MLKDLKKFARVSINRAASLLGRGGSGPVSAADILDSSAGRGAIDQFHALWYASVGAASMTWQGHPILKNPMDLWIYQEILHRRRPELIIETGTHHGGSALYFAMLAQLGNFPLDILTIDINPKIAYDAAAYRIRPVRGISTTSATVNEVRTLIEGIRQRLGHDPRTMVILDSDHSRDNVLDELRAYAPMVTPGDYLVVEDTNVNGHPVLLEHGPGPYEAVEQFLLEQAAFARDESCERLLVTHNPGGWLRRIV